MSWHPDPLPQVPLGVTSPQIALCLQSPDEVEPTLATVTAAASGLAVLVGNDLAQVLAGVVPNELLLLVIDAPLAPPGALEVLMSVCPKARAIVITEIVSEAQLVSALRLPRLLGFVARTAGAVRPWELAYLVRRAVTPQTGVPTARELLGWWSAHWAFRPQTPRDLDRVSRAVDLAAGWGGMPDAGDLAGRAAAVLTSNAMFHAPLDAEGAPRYSPDWRPDRLMADEVPEVTLTTDGTLLAVEAHDRFGALSRARAFGGLLRPDQASAHAGIAADRVGLGFFRLLYSAAILRFDVTPGGGTRVTWIHDRRIGRRSHQGQARSVYFLGAD